MRLNGEVKMWKLWRTNMFVLWKKCVTVRGQKWVTNLHPLAGMKWEYRGRLHFPLSKRQLFGDTEGPLFGDKNWEFWEASLILALGYVLSQIYQMIQDLHILQMKLIVTYQLENETEAYSSVWDKPKSLSEASPRNVQKCQLSGSGFVLVPKMSRNQNLTSFRVWISVRTQNV